MGKIKCNLKNKNLLYIIFMFLFWGFIYFNVPIGHDDWYWGSHLGTDNFVNMFGDLNGRYLGSLVTLLLTRTNIIRVLLMTAITGSIMLFMSKIIINNETEDNTKINKITVIGCILVLFTPRLIFKQTFSWISGFSNYVPPILLMLIYINSIKKLFLGEFEEDKSIKSVMFYFLLSIISQLFMEHMTLYFIVLSISVLVYSYIRYKKVSAKDLAYFIGIISGTVIMFANPAYYKIAIQEDAYNYRNMPTGGIVQTIKSAIYQFASLINYELLMEMIVLVIVLSCAALACVYKSKKQNVSLLTKASVAVIIMYPIYLLYFKYQTELFVGPRTFKFILQGCFSILYYLCLLFIIITTIEEKSVLHFSIFLLVSAWVLIAPLTVVNPVGGRNMLASYILLVILAMQLISYIRLSDNIILNYSIICTHIVIVISLGVVFRSIGVDARFRAKEIERQIESNSASIVVPNIRHADYLQVGNPPFKNGYSATDAFRAYYNLDESIDINNAMENADYIKQ